MSSLMVAGYHDLWYADSDLGPAPFSPVAVKLGSTGEEGIRITIERKFDDVVDESYGPGTVVDKLYRGGNCFVEFVLQEINTDVVRNFISPMRETRAPAGNLATHNEVGQVGSYANEALGGSLIAVPVTNTPADLAHQGTALSSRIFRGIYVGDLVETLDTTLNAIPIKFQCFAHSDGGKQVWWIWSP